jgi:uncharacterized FlaG/YvyC family protein
MLDCRKEACKEINEMFPELNVDVEFVLDTDIGGDINVE